MRDSPLSVGLSGEPASPGGERRRNADVDGCANIGRPCQTQSMAARAPEVDFDIDVVEAPVCLLPWQTVVWDDPVNLMNYVSYVFRSYFGYSVERAERLMMQVHTNGSAVVASGNREAMERHVVAMHGFGLNATLRRAGEDA